MARMMRNANVLGETTVFRAQRFGHVHSLLVLKTSLEADGQEMTQLINGIHGLLKNPPEFAGFEIHSAQHVYLRAIRRHRPIGFFHVDIAEVQTAQGKLYLFVTIDRTPSSQSLSRSARLMR